jgi:peptide/nickel transport system substrate-binding protein
MNKERQVSLFVVLLALAFAACQGQTVEVTRIVTERQTVVETVNETVIETVIETIVEKGEPLVVTREVPVEVEVEVEKQVLVTATPASGGVFAGALPYSPPPVGHLNPSLANALAGAFYRDLMYLPLGMYNWADGTWNEFLAEGWGFLPPDVFQVRLRQGVKWSDGADFTAEDITTSYNIARLQNHAVWRFLDHIEVVDDHTVNFVMSNPSTVVERYVIRGYARPVILSTSLFGEWSERVQALVDAGMDSESDEWQALLQEFNEFRPQDLVVTGPYKLDIESVNEARLTLVKNEQAYLAGAVKFDKIYLYNGETTAITPLVLTRQVDYATHGFPPATEKAFEAEGIRILRPPIFAGPALYLNHAIYPLDVKGFRQALAHAIDREENAAVSLGASAVAQKYMVGFTDNIVPLWLSEAEMAQLNTYPHDTDRAADMLNELGFARDAEGVWTTDRGGRLEFELIAPAEFADWSAGAENLAEQLTTFGVKTTFRAVPYAQYLADLDQGNFELALDGWGAGDPHPHFAYRSNLFRVNTEAAGGPGMSFPMVHTTGAVGEIDLEEEILSSVAGLDEGEQKARIARVALAYNELLPQIPLWERYGNNPAMDGLHTCGWKPEGDPIYQNSPYSDSFVVLMILDGTLYPCNQ